MENKTITSVLTKDGVTVKISISSKNILCALLEQKIIDDIKLTMDYNLAIKNIDNQLTNITLIDSNNKSHNFIKSFSLTINNDYTKVIDASLITYVEV